MTALEGEFWEALGRKRRHVKLAERLAAAAAELQASATLTQNESRTARQRLNRQIDAASSIEQSARAMLKALGARRQPIQTALADGHLTPSSGHLSAPRTEPRTLADLGIGRWAAADEATRTLIRLADEAAEWQLRAKLKERRRGRPAFRGDLSEWVGLQVAKAHEALVTTPTAVWASVIAVYYRALDLGVKPSFDTLKAAQAHIKRTFPTIWQSRKMTPGNRRLPRR